MTANFTPEFTIASDWGQGFTGNISIANTGNEDLNDWVLEFDFPYEITNIWNAEIVSREGDRYTIRNAGWNGDIAEGSGASFGFNASPGNVTMPPTNYVIEGATIDAPNPAPQPILSISDVTIAEGDAGDTVATFDVELSQESDETVTVDYATANDTAVAGEDYEAVAGTLSFAPGQTTKTINVNVSGDTNVESNESFFLELNNALNAEIDDAQGKGTINNDDQQASPTPTPQPQLSINDVVITEGDNGTSNAVFNISLSAASTEQVTVNYGSANGSAEAGSDYNGTSGTLTFNPGETSKEISVSVNGDTSLEGDETFNINLSNANNATIDDGQGVATILNNDSNNGGGGGSPQTGDFNYGEALQKSFLFYEAQRSGDLPNDNRVSWRGDSALNDGSDVGIDLSGGYYDAGDHVKFGLPMASSMTMLGWGVNEYRDAYQQSGQLDEALDAIKWGTDYILKAHVTEGGKTKEFYGQVGNGGIDHSYWGAPEDMNMARPSYKIDAANPGSDLAGEASAALAAASIAFRPTDSNYADTLLDNAKQLYEFADTYRGKYSDSIPDAANFYNSWSGYNDELAWGAAWLDKAVKASGENDNSYLNKAKSAYQGIGGGWTQSWDDKSYGTGILLAQETGDSQYRNDVEGWLDSWLPGGSSVTYTNGGLAWLNQWGSLRYSANTSFLAGVYGDTVNDPNSRYTDFAESQIDYILGDNPNNFSYMVGFGDNFPKNPHHRAASGTTNIGDSNDNQYTLYGALVGGPASPNDNDYVDDRTDYIRNEVALDYNASFTGALARMYDEFGGEPLASFEVGGEALVI
ncbi:MAG: glycoside hydrolase family 9 protein [Coleofasciculaceae cyanobacterium]